jgi:hypothetical protein
MQVYVSYLIAPDAKSWPSRCGIPVVQKEATAGDPIAVHHIFPKKYMADRETPLDLLITVVSQRHPVAGRQRDAERTGAVR